jgi:hypothetical protein
MGRASSSVQYSFTKKNYQTEKMKIKVSFLFVVVLGFLCASCNNSQRNPFGFSKAMSVEELASSLRADDLIVDTVLSQSNVDLMYIRYTPVTLFGKVGTLVTTVKNDKIVKYDWVYDNIDKWVHSFSSRAMYKKLSPKNTNLLVDLLHDSVSSGDFLLLHDSLSKKYGEAVVSSLGLDSLFFWKEHNVSLHLYNKKSTITISSSFDGTSDNNEVKLRFKSITQDTLLPHLKLGIAKKVILEMLQLRDTQIVINEMQNATAKVMDYECWGIPGILSLVFNDNNILVGVFWNYRSTGEFASESNFFYCGSLINQQFGDEYSPVLRKTFVVGEAMMAWHNKDESIIFLYKENKSFSFAHIDDKVYSLPDYSK